MGGVAEMDQNLKLFFLKVSVQPQDDSRQLEEGRGGSGCVVLVALLAEKPSQSIKKQYSVVVLI